MDLEQVISYNDLIAQYKKVLESIGGQGSGIK